MDLLMQTYQILSATLFAVATLIVVAHIWSCIMPKPKVKLDKTSVVVLTGACMGIGRQMALQIAQKYQSTLVLIDRRDDLFE